jgi:small nuclear ribonucleoprotein (snRNP)-like protein
VEERQNFKGGAMLIGRFYKFNHIVTMVCLCTIVITLVAPRTAQAKGSKTLGWENVLRLRRGAKVAVVLFSKKTYWGKVDQVEPNNLVLATDAGSMMLPKEEINSVTTLAKPKLASPGAWMIVGGALLAGVGSLVNTTKDVVTLNNGKMPSKHSDAVTIAGVVGMVGGVAIVIFGGKPRFIYEAKPVQSSPTN